MDKQMMKYLGILVVLILCIVVFYFFTGKSNSKLEYREMEALLVKATREYAKDNPKILPTEEDSNQPSINAKTLENLGYIRDLSSYAKDDTTCTGEVEIYQTYPEVYNYVPRLSCGKFYTYKPLSEKIIEDNGIASRGAGLYARYDGKFLTDDNDIDTLPADEYVFRGDNVNNFIRVETTYWRVIAIDKDGNLLAILASNLSKMTPWDNRYNINTGRNNGINDYENNGIKSNAMLSVENVLHEKVALSEDLYSSRVKYLISKYDLCIGKRYPKDEGRDGKYECKKQVEGQFGGLLPAYYFMSASLDENCKKTTSKSCGNYNYLSNYGSWWIMTSDAENTNSCYLIDKKAISIQDCSYSYNFRPVVKFGSRAVYSTGKGTKADPYIIRYIPKNA